MGYKEEYLKWLNSGKMSKAEMDELKSIENDEKEIESRFFSSLDFGTAGLRGTMGAGLYRMNNHVVKHFTQGFANVIRAEGPDCISKGVVICYDCRNNSRKFAEAAACVMAGNDIPVKMFESLRPTPELSFAIRHYGASAGINITASHNPKEYNGYKVYWSDGAQLPPQHADAIAEAVKGIDIFEDIYVMNFDYAVKTGKIEIIGEETDEAYLGEVIKMAVNPEIVREVADEFKVIYTPFHGTGHKLVPEILKRLGMKHVIPVPEQMVIDGDFPTVASPNPENPEGFTLGIELAKANGSNLIIGTDPDADRVGVMVKNSEGEYVTISGNQMGVLLLDYIIKAKKSTNTMPKNPAALKSIVSTEMAAKVAEANGVHMDSTFTGFKFLAEKIKEYETTGEHQYIFAFEESYGYLVGDYARDKDAVTASMLITEMAADYYKKGMTLYDALQSLYKEYGYYKEVTINLVMPGLDGLEKMAELMKKLRANPLKAVSDISVKDVVDYSNGIGIDMETGDKFTVNQKGANVLYYHLVDGTSYIVRPSGTEPKIKVYVMAAGASGEECEEKVRKCREFTDNLK